MYYTIRSMTDPEFVLRANGDEYAAHASKAVRLAGAILPQLDNGIVLNGRLDIAGRTDLRMSDRVEVAPLDFVPDPSNKSHIGCFVEGFQMTEPYALDVTGNIDTSVRPISTESLQAMIRQPFDPRSMIHHKDHRARPAFWRALALYPGFFVNLTTDLGAEKNVSLVYGPDIYLAYQVMSRLVGARDPGVITESGNPDRRYLYRRTVKLSARELLTTS